MSSEWAKRTFYIIDHCGIPSCWFVFGELVREVDDDCRQTMLTQSSVFKIFIVFKYGINWLRIWLIRPYANQSHSKTSAIFRLSLMEIHFVFIETNPFVTKFYARSYGSFTSHKVHYLLALTKTFRLSQNITFLSQYDIRHCDVTKNI